MQVYHAERDQGGSAKQYIDALVGLRPSLTHGAAAPRGVEHPDAKRPPRVKERVVVHQGERSERPPAADRGGRNSAHGGERQAGGPARREPRTTRPTGAANWNVIALTDLKGAVLERYYTSPYGELEVVANSYFGDYDGDGFVNAGDGADLCTNGCTCSFGTATGDCRVFDFDADGDLDATDQQILASLYTGRSADLQNRRIPSTSASPLGNPFAHQGLVLDPEIHSYQNRARQYNPGLNRFAQRDPICASVTTGAVVSANQYAFVGAQPTLRTEPFGTVRPPAPRPTTTPGQVSDPQSSRDTCTVRFRRSAVLPGKYHVGADFSDSHLDYGPGGLSCILTLGCCCDTTEWGNHGGDPVGEPSAMPQGCCDCLKSSPPKCNPQLPCNYQFLGIPPFTNSNGAAHAAINRCASQCPGLVIPPEINDETAPGWNNANCGW